MNPKPMAQHDKREGLATAKEAGRFLAVSRTTLWRLAASGTLAPVRIGRALRFRWTDLHAMAAGGEQ